MHLFVEVLVSKSFGFMHWFMHCQCYALLDGLSIQGSISKLYLHATLTDGLSTQSSKSCLHVTLTVWLRCNLLASGDILEH